MKGQEAVQSSLEMRDRIEQAVQELIAKLEELHNERDRNDTTLLPSPDELISMVAAKKDRDPYKAALMSLITDGTVVPSSRWRLELQSHQSQVR